MNAWFLYSPCRRCRTLRLLDSLLSLSVQARQSVQQLGRWIGAEEELADRTDDERPCSEAQYARPVLDFIHTRHPAPPIISHARQPGDANPMLLTRDSATVQSLSNPPKRRDGLSGKFIASGPGTAARLGTRCGAKPLHPALRSPGIGSSPFGTGEEANAELWIPSPTRCDRSCSYRRITSARFSFIRISRTVRAHWVRR